MLNETAKNGSTKNTYVTALRRAEKLAPAATEEAQRNGTLGAGEWPSFKAQIAFTTAAQAAVDALAVVVAS
jgi:hypothetical protein